MAYLCPVCNGLQALSISCPKCGSTTACRDEGRFNDFLGPYSPYRPIDDVGLTNGFMDVHSHRCTHVVNCGSCGNVFHSFVQEWPFS